MGLSSLAALIAVGLAFAAQSPKFLAKTRLAGYRLDLRARAFTGYGFALMLLALGFFLAGVPIGELGGGETTAVTQADQTPQANEVGIVGGASEDVLAGENVAPRPTSLTPVSGAFGGPPPGIGGRQQRGRSGHGGSNRQQRRDFDAHPRCGDNCANGGVPNTPTPTSSPTQTPTPTPTVTPTPTLTPTPIEGPTAVIDVGGGTVWLRSSPDGQNMLILNHGDTVILLSGHANRAGILWREVSTVQGDVGWIRAQFLRNS
jgi:hypothetical protein